MCEAPRVIWVTHVSQLYRCAPEHIRQLSDRESQAVQNDPAKTGETSFPRNLGSGVFQYHDLTGNTSPGNPLSVDQPPNSTPPQAESIPIPNTPINPETSQHNPPPSNPEQPDSEPSDVAEADQQPATPQHEDVEPPTIDASTIPVPDSESEHENGDVSSHDALAAR